MTKFIYTSKIHSNRSINYLLTKEKKLGIKKLKNPKAFTDYSQAIDYVYENLEDYNPTKERKVATVFDDMIVDLEVNKESSPIFTELLLRGKKPNISLVFISQFYFKVPKTIRRNTTNCFTMKIPNKRELQQTTSRHLSDIEFKDFMKLYKDCTKEPYSFLVNDTIFSSDNPLIFRKNLL